MSGGEGGQGGGGGVNPYSSNVKPNWVLYIVGHKGRLFP